MIRKALNWDPSPSFLVSYHKAMMVVWTLLIFPTIMFWKTSILWVAFMSLYANWVGHFSAYDASVAAAAAEKEREEDEP